MCRKHFTCHITIHITRNVLQSPCLTCGYHKECAKNISPATSPSTSRKMTPGHGKWLVAMADDFTTFICPTGHWSILHSTTGSYATGQNAPVFECEKFGSLPFYHLYNKQYLQLELCRRVFLYLFDTLNRTTVSIYP